MSAFLSALRLMTVLPVGRGDATRGNAEANSPAFFPLVGLLIGLVSAAVFVGLGEFLPVSVAAALAIAVAVALSGGLHIDGLGDTADGLFGGRTRERKLEIMSDSRVGAFGVTAIVLMLVAKWAVVSELDPGSHWSLLVVVAVSSRGVASLAVAAFPYARSQGIGSHYSGAALWVVPMAALLSLPLVLVFGSLISFIAVGAAVLVGLGIAFYSLRSIGGLTGDVYGAIIEMSELAALLTLLGLVEAEFDAGVIW